MIFSVFCLVCMLNIYMCSIAILIVHKVMLLKNKEDITNTVKTRYPSHKYANLWTSTPRKCTSTDQILCPALSFGKKYPQYSPKLSSRIACRFSHVCSSASFSVLVYLITVFLPILLDSLVIFINRLNSAN